VGETPTIRWAELLPGADLMSAAELMALPQDRWRYELVSGRRLRMPPTELRHELIAHDLLYVLKRFVTAAGLGSVSLPQTGFVLNRPDQPDTVLVPALAFMRAERMTPTQAATSSIDYLLRLVPDLVVEVAASGQHRPALAEKTALWLGAGVRSVWVVWPARRQVDCWHLGPDGQEGRTLNADERLDDEDIVPGFSYLVAHLFM
jgi:Uma2 family endonuclease